jgi:ABC-2 type transport system permease protein
MSRAMFRAMPLSAAAHPHRLGGFIILLVVVIAVAVGLVLLIQRHRDRRPVNETTAAARDELSHPSPASKSRPSLVTRTYSLSSDPLAQGATTGWKKELPPGRYGLGELLRSEWTKLRTVRSTVWTLGLTILIGIAISAIATGASRATWSTMSAADRAGFDPIGRTLIGVYFGQFTIGVLGVLAMSAEYSTGTIRATFCAAPRRTSILAAKALVFGAVALVVSEIVAFASFFLGQAFLTAPAAHATIGSPGALRAVAGSGLFLCVMGLFALGLATIIRHTAGAISALVALLLVLPLIIQALPTSLNNDLSRYTPLRIGAVMVSGPPLSHTFSPWTGLAVLLIYAAVLLAAGAVLLVKRDA